MHQAMTDALDVEVYYEDTDFSGVVYHANYLRYMERAREHLLGREELVRLYREEGVGFVVYQASLAYKEGAVFGDTLEVRTHAREESLYRAVFHQRVHRKRDGKLLVDGEIHLVCVDARRKPVPLPVAVRRLLRAQAQAHPTSSRDG